jgi:polysaccharide biosynthesis protein PslJ
MNLPWLRRERWAAREAIALGLAVGAAGLAVGALLGFAGPLITVGALLALAAGLWALTNLEVGLWGTIGIITLLPFAALPIKIVFTPNFVDLTLISVVLVYLLQWMTGRRRRLRLTPAHAPIAVFMALALFSFVAGMPNGPLTSNLLRQFGELLLNIGLTFVIVDYVDNAQTLTRLVRVIVLGGTAAAALGIGLYLLPPNLSERLLSALGVFGYPAGGVLRYIEDNPENAQRAISTSVDPNFLGGLLAMVGGLLAPQLLTRRPVLWNRWLTAGAFVVVLACLLLTFSRGAMAGLGLAMLVVALARYRRLLWVLALAGVVVLLLPATQAYVAHFVEGVRGDDLATQMRLGEYKDAFILISRYPVLGVGFAGAPEIDIYLGVSSAYLLIAEQMGLVGLAAFGLVMATVLVWAFSRRQAVYAAGEHGADGLPAQWLGLLAGLIAALAVGVIDHYFFRLSFQSAGTLFWLYVGLLLAATKLAVEYPANDGKQTDVKQLRYNPAQSRVQEAP